MTSFPFESLGVLVSIVIEREKKQEISGRWKLSISLHWYIGNVTEGRLYGGHSVSDLGSLLL